MKDENEALSQKNSNFMKKQAELPVWPRRSERNNKGKLPEKLTYFTGESVEKPARFKLQIVNANVRYFL